MSKHILVVGGTKGIGRVFVKKFAKKNYQLDVISRNVPKEPENTKKVKYWPLDLNKSEKIPGVIKKIVASSGKLDGLVFFQRFRGERDSFEGEMQVSVYATQSIIENLQDSFNEKGEKSIVIVNSIARLFIAEEQPLSYHVGKSALNQVIKYYALTLGCKGIRVNGVSPNTVVKPEAEGFYKENKELCDLYKDISPLNKMTMADEVVDVIGFFMSQDSRAVTGQDIVVDGGISLQWHEGLARKVKGLDNLNLTRKSGKR